MLLVSSTAMYHRCITPVSRKAALCSQAGHIQPIVFTAIPTDGQTISSPATVSLAMHGITHTVVFTIMDRSNGSVLEAIGSAPVLVSDWGLKSPFGIHNTALIEFLVVLRRG